MNWWRDSSKPNILLSWPPVEASPHVRPCYRYFWPVLTRFRLYVNIFRQHGDFEFWFQNMFRLFSDTEWYTPLWYLSKFFFLIILIFDGRFFHWGSREIFHRYRNLDSPVVTRSSTFVHTTCRKVCSYFIHILARVSCCLGSLDMEFSFCI